MKAPSHAPDASGAIGVGVPLGGGFQGPHLQKAKSTPQTVSENTNGAIKHSLPSIVLNRLPGPVRHVFLNSDLIF